MRRASVPFGLLFLGSLVPALAAPPAPVRPKSAPLPVVNGVEAVAVVNGEPIPLADVERQLAKIHMEADLAAPMGQDPSALLERMITAKLIAQEARTAGFDEQEEYLAAIGNVESSVMRDILIERETKNIKPDPARVEKFYEDLVRVYTIGSVAFPKQIDALEFETGIKAGGDFFKLARQAMAAGKAKGTEAAQAVKATELVPGVAKLLGLLKPGQTGPIMQSEKDWAFVHFVAVAYPENPEAREAAREKALESQREEAIKRYSAALRAKYAKVDEKLLASLDFEKKGAIAELVKDTRPLATIKGEAPVTVGDLGKGMERRFFHGVDRALSDSTKHVNTEKAPVLDDVINRRVVPLEAKVLKIDDTPEFKERVARGGDQILFELYVKRAILPEVKITEDDLKAYYDAHKADYTTPEMVQLEALVFSGRAEAQDAFAKLQKGADWNWVKANAPGRVPKEKQDELSFPKGLVVTSTLPDAAEKAIKGANSGDYRFYEATASGPFEVIVLRDRRPTKIQELNAVKKVVADKVYAEQLAKTIAANAAALRKASKVEVFATGDQLKRVIMRDLQGDS